jgi:hypothetical protein
VDCEMKFYQGLLGMCLSYGRVRYSQYSCMVGSMALAHPSASKHRLQLSTLLLLLIGMCSIGSPDSLKSAHLHHRSPSSSSRTSRHVNRPRANGSSRTSSDAEVEPEIAAASSETAAPPEHVRSLALFAPVTRTYERGEVCVSCVEQDDVAIALCDAPLPHLGRAPPLA